MGDGALFRKRRNGDRKWMNMVSIQCRYTTTGVKLCKIQRPQEVIAEAGIIALEIFHPERGIKRPEVHFDELTAS